MHLKQHLFSPRNVCSCIHLKQHLFSPTNVCSCIHLKQQHLFSPRNVCSCIHLKQQHLFSPTNVCSCIHLKQQHLFSAIFLSQGLREQLSFYMLDTYAIIEKFYTQLVEKQVSTYHIPVLYFHG